MSDRKAKKAQFAQPQQKRLPHILIIAALMVVAVGVIAWDAMAGGRSGKFAVVGANQGQVFIPVAQVSDGSAHFFTYKNGTTDVNFLVVKSLDGQIRAALDSCDVCYKGRMGYRQEGDSMVCVKCKQKFHSNLINEIKGGCNPVPLQRAVIDGKLVIPEAELIQGAAYFQSNPL